MRLLLVEDDARVASVMQSVLRRHGYQVARAEDGRRALDQPPDSFDMVLLDLGLPDIDGTQLCTRLRTRSDAPIIVVTARSELASMVEVLGLGADDYLVKPFDLRELIARIQAVGRRRVHPATAGTPQRYVQARGVRIDLAARKVWAGDQLVMLTRKEFDLVAALARQPGVALRREQIIGEVWQTGWQGMGRSLEVHVASVRNKVGVPDLIETVRGVGYALAAG